MGNPALAICALCAAGNPVTGSAVPPQPIEPPDFDTRPGEPLRGTILSWVQSCKACGYCAEDISKAAAEAGSIVQSPAYRNMREDAGIAVAARPFFCYASLLDRMGQHSDSGWSCLHAAWISDDAGHAESAFACRAQALAMWQKGKAVGQPFSDDLVSEFALVTDVYRRTGQFESATVACSEGLDIESIPRAIEAVLRRQLTLIQSRDTAAHSLSELLRTS